MTVCIAVGADNSTSGNGKIVLCADTLISGPMGKSETKLKIRHLAGNWRLLVAGGDDIVPTGKIISDSFLDARRDGIDEDVATKLVRDALAKRKRVKTEEYTQAHYAMSYDEFVRTGKDKLPDEEHRLAWAEIRSMKLDAEFIVAGFTPDGFPALIETNTKGETLIREDFAVIGSGCYLAQATLMQRQVADVSSLWRNLYAAFEAKRFAEGETAVGKETFIRILTPTGDMRVTAVGEAWLNERFAEYGPKHVPRADVSMPDGATEARDD